mmetsp:Transcript_24055/g.52706  ORF Transcript_24055/g.52706 Transcript_24055/m.52706 type:complete len:148 (+) Transcript_24055:1387-1830(+)
MMMMMMRASLPRGGSEEKKDAAESTIVIENDTNESGPDRPIEIETEIETTTMTRMKVRKKRGGGKKSDDAGRRREGGKRHTNHLPRRRGIDQGNERNPKKDRATIDYRFEYIFSLLAYIDWTRQPCALCVVRCVFVTRYVRYGLSGR